MEAVACIIFNKARNEVLLIQRRDIPVWVLPGGGIDPGEAPEEAAIREALEETGLQVILDRKVARYLPKNRLTQVTHLYECIVVAGELKTGSETRQISFFSLTTLPKRLVPFYRTWIEDSIEKREGVVEKTISHTSYWTLVWYLICHPLLVAQFFLTRIGIHLNR